MHVCNTVPYYPPSTFTPIGKRVHIVLFPEVKLDFVTKLSRIHGNIMRTNQVTGNIIVSTCCLDNMAVNAPSQTCANYYILHVPANADC